MRPDAELESLSPAALEWIDERLDELRAALSRFMSDPDSLSAIRAVTERTARAAFRRCNAAWKAPTSLRSKVIDAFYEADDRLAERLAQTLSPAERQALEREIRGALEATCGAPSPWVDELERHERASRKLGRYVTPRWPGQHHPASFAAEKQLQWDVAFGDDERTPSPWAPFVAMFERGAWPTLLPDATVLVYVPVLSDGHLVPDPSKARTVKRFPVREPRSAPTPTPIPAIERMGVSTPPSVLGYTPTAGRMGRIAVVRPTPREEVAPPVKAPRRGDGS